MSPLKLTPPQWRVLRYLGTYYATATRVGFLTKQLRAATGATEADLTALADLGHIVGRLHGSADAPSPSTVHTARAHRKLRIHLTPAGKSAAATIDTAYRALVHLRAYGPHPAHTLHDAGIGDDTLTQLDRHGLIYTIAGPLLALTRIGDPYAEPYAQEQTGSRPAKRAPEHADPSQTHTHEVSTWHDMAKGDHIHIRRQFHPRPHPTTGHRLAEWSGTVLDNSAYGFTIMGDDGKRHGFFAWPPGPGYTQTVTRRQRASENRS
ncbi:hypothetical protein ACTMTF_34720 [Nonomuraea sp. ZG12]|uniref:hypothetical protein n=1 Tax=Nonomuraea sp. ZG12 TaxID=3452207 RepID=UPI003F8919B4